MKPSKFFYLPFAKMILIIISISILLSSCAEIISASLDNSSQKQGGNSKDDNIAYEPDLNVMMLFGGILAKMATSRERHVESVPVYEDMYNAGGKSNLLKIMPGLAYIGKGYKSKDGNSTTKVHLNYLEIPVYFVYEHPLATGALFAGLGPYFSYGIGGKIKGDFGSLKSFGEDNGGFKRFDAGLGIMAGYKMDNGFQIHIGYDHGLANIAYATQDFTAKNRTFSLNIGYNISGLFKSHKK